MVVIPEREAFAVGRSPKADYIVTELEDTAVSLTHAGLRYDDTRRVLVLTDRSQNGTGVIPKGGAPADAVPLEKGTPMQVRLGDGILIPMKRLDAGRAREDSEILWLEAPPEVKKMEETRVKNLPICNPQPRPASWPKTWASLQMEVQDLWAREGIEDAQDLRDVLHDGTGGKGPPRAGGGQEDGVGPRRDPLEGRCEGLFDGGTSQDG